MRLLQAKSIEADAGLAFADFGSHELPSFALLAHSAGDVEVTYADAVAGTPAAARDKANYEKLVLAGRQALADGYEYLFVDSCCVDRRSSAELTEAANSALQWHRSAGHVYAYLPDCPADERAAGPATPFAASRWWRDPWMLVPLLAARTLVFYAARWTKIGTKAGLADEIAAVAGVAPRFVTGERPLETASVAQRMSWAARRTAAARAEDVAYALMALFAVHMPLLYGEGERAFLRLQEEIMRHSDDYSLFAWLDDSAHPDQQYGLLATTPRWFEKSGHVVPYAHSQSWAPYKMTNRGLKIESIVQHRAVGVGGGRYALALDCPAGEDNTYLAVYLHKCSNNEYVRVRANEFDRISRSEWALERGNTTKVYVRQDVDRITPFEGGLYPFHAMRFRQGPDPSAHQLVGLVRSSGFPDQYKHYKGAFDAKLEKLSYLPQAKLSKEPGKLSVGLCFANNEGQRLAVLFGSSADGIGLACDALEIARADRGAKAMGAGLPSFAELEDAFAPKEPGRDIDLAYFRVKVTAERKCSAEQKLYDINVEIEGIDVLPAYEEVQDRDEQQAAAAAAAAAATSSKRESRNILKRLLK